MKVAVIGSSPLALLDAVDAAAAGHDVTVFEATAGLGGAWGVTTFAGFADVEIGCHLLERESRGYRRLEAAGVELLPLDPQPVTALRPGLHQAYASPAVAGVRLAYQPVARALRPSSATPAEWKRRRALAAKEFRDALTDRSPVLGPVGGAGQMVASLSATARACGVQIRTETAVRFIDLSDRPPVVRLDKGSETFDRVVITAAYDPAGLLMDGSPVDGEVRRRRFEHRLLAMPADTVTAHSYWRFPRDAVLQRSSLITPNARRETADPGIELVLVSVVPDENPSVADLLRCLARYGLIEANATPVDHRAIDYVGVDATDALEAALGRRHDVVVRRSYGDLIRSIVNLPRLGTADSDHRFRTERAS